jgi:hypothetical protein
VGGWKWRLGGCDVCVNGRMDGCGGWVDVVDVLNVVDVVYGCMDVVYGWVDQFGWRYGWTEGWMDGYGGSIDVVDR